MRGVFTKKKVLIGACLLALGIAGFYLVSLQTENPSYLQKIYPEQEIKDVGDKHYRVGTDDIYVARISVGGVVLYQIYEKTNSRYRFFTTEEEPRLLKEVEVVTPPNDADEALNRNFFMRDITEDGIEELFVRVLRSGSNLSEWEIIKPEGGALASITIRGQKDNPLWVEFDEIGTRGSTVWLDWHGSDMQGRNYYRLEGNELVYEKGVRIAFANGSEECRVSVSNAGDADFTFIETKLCAEITYAEDNKLAFDRYFIQSPDQLAFMTELYYAKSNPNLSYLAQVYDKECEVPNGAATFGGAKTFRDLLQRAEAAEALKITSEGHKVLIIPCGQGAYQSWYLPAYYDGNTYTPIALASIDRDGKRQVYRTATELYYSAETDTFSYRGAGNGMHTCWQEGQYKLVGKELVLQKYIADWDCEDADGEQDEGEVIYDINNSGE